MNTATVTAPSLDEFFAAEALLPLSVEGMPQGLFCKLLSLEEINVAMADHENQLRVGAQLLALCIVDEAGNPKTTVQQWLKLSFKKSDIVQRAIREVSLINGLAKADEVEELGNDSAPTGDCDSSSNSA